MLKVIVFSWCFFFSCFYRFCISVVWLGFVCSGGRVM